MQRSFIISEIQRTAKENDGKPLGRQKFETETGIKENDWYGVYWARWSDALREAGFAPNQFQVAFNKADLLTKYAELTQYLGHLPTDGEIRLKARADKNFPNHSTLQNRFGSKAELVKQLLAFCQSRDEYKDIVKECEAYSEKAVITSDSPMLDVVEIGYVYLVKSGRYYKIGHSNATGRRTYELDLQLPEKTKTIHVIRTDDPPGIESYWHNRFASKRMNGEWFDLGAAEVAAFKRRKVM